MRNFTEAYEKILTDIEKLKADIETAQGDHEAVYTELGSDKLCEMLSALYDAEAILETVDTDIKMGSDHARIHFIRKTH